MLDWRPGEEEPRVRSSDDVHDDLTARGVAHQIVALPSSSRTAHLAAEALGVGVAHVVKSLLFILDEENPVLVLVAGDATVDVAMLAREMGASKVRLARSREVREVTGYRPGGVSPCALATEVPVVADPRVFTPQFVYCGGGTTTTMLGIRSADLAGVLDPRILPVALEGSSGEEASRDRSTGGQPPGTKSGHKQDEWRTR
jgi:Cys-tRNA(Pro) deacylase